MTEDDLKLLKRGAGLAPGTTLIGLEPALCRAVLALARPRESERPAIPLHSNNAPMRHRMKAILVHEDMTPSAAEDILDTLFDILEQDPGHDATSYAVVPGSDRTATVSAYTAIIQAIRRGE